VSSIGTVEPVESLTTPFLPLFHYDSFITDSNGDSGNYIFTQADGTNNPLPWYHRTKRNGVWETLDENKFAVSMFESRANTSNTLRLTVKALKESSTLMKNLLLTSAWIRHRRALGLVYRSVFPLPNLSPASATGRSETIVP
jgi:hypothetical protein